MYAKKLYNGTTAHYDRALSCLPTAQAGVNFAPSGELVLMSYTTAVLVLDRENWLTCTGLYSATTRKQIGWFLKEYAPAITFQMVKKCVETDTMINIHTGEIVPLFP